MVAVIRIEVSYPPSANRYKLPRIIPVRRGSQPAITWYLSKEAKAFKEEVAWRAKQAGIRSPVSGFVRVVLTLIPHQPKDVADRARKDPKLWPLTVQSLDVGNVEKVALDALNGLAWNDDRQIEELIVRRAEPGQQGLVIEFEEFTPAWLDRTADLFGEVAA